MILATLIGKNIYVSHHSVCKCKFNQIEYSHFAFISLNLVGIPLESVELLANLITNTKTTAIFNVECSIDNKTYELHSSQFSMMNERIY